MPNHLHPTVSCAGDRCCRHPVSRKGQVLDDPTHFPTFSERHARAQLSLLKDLATAAAQCDVEAWELLGIEFQDSWLAAAPRLLRALTECLDRVAAGGTEPDATYITQVTGHVVERWESCLYLDRELISASLVAYLHPESISRLPAAVFAYHATLSLAWLTETWSPSLRAALLERRLLPAPR